MTARAARLVRAGMRQQVDLLIGAAVHRIMQGKLPQAEIIRRLGS